MKLFRELISDIEKKYPNDHFFENLDAAIKTSRSTRLSYAAYERAFKCLDQKGWNILKEKSIKKFKNERQGQLKQGFFNQINEAFAYQYLLKNNFKKIKFLTEDGKTKPDIQYNDGREKRFCEVKTIGISQKEILKRKNIETFKSHELYGQLSTEFINKLNSTINTAVKQIKSQGDFGLVYLIILFDDFTNEHYDTYRVQILNCINSHKFQNIYVKIGHHGQRRILK